MDNTTKHRKTDRYRIDRVADPEVKERIVAELVAGGDTAFSSLDPVRMAVSNDSIFVAYKDGKPVGFAGLSFRSEPNLRAGNSTEATLQMGNLGFTFLGQGESREAYPKLFAARLEDCIFRWL